MFSKLFKDTNSKLTIILTIIILIISYFTYVYNYTNPAQLFWDENFYLASAQKYLNGIFFLHDQPPFGQLLIALGEKLVNANNFSSFAINTDYAKDLPEGFSFAGYRLIPVLLAWLTAPLIFFLFLLLTNHHWLSFCLSFLYIFNNALIVHFRAAMLDSTLIFLIVSILLLFLTIDKYKHNNLLFIYLTISLGIVLALIATTKLTGLIVILLFPGLAWRLFPDWQRMLVALGLSLFGFVITFIMVWQVHFSLANNINPQLQNTGYYSASPEYVQIVKNKQNTSLLSFPIMLRDSLAYMSSYHHKVPRLNLCKPDENGSPAWFWLVGARSINYRWETPDNKVYQYLYLQVNPVIWLVGLIGVILGTCFWLASWLLPLRQPLQNRFLLTVFLGLYWGYMVGVSSISRVMYLYHYFPALIFSFCLFALVIKEIYCLNQWHLTLFHKQIAMSFIASLIIIAYSFYSPLTYYQPLSDAQFQRRMIFPLWDLRCVNCERTSPLVIPKT